MINATFRPLEKWPREETPSRERRNPFASLFVQTMDLLERELNHLLAKNIVVQIDCDLSQIRNDGWPRSDAKVNSPRVAITFESKHGVLTYYCDYCLKWIDNVRAIAMTLERLRLADLYGCTKTGEQYQGFKALPPPGIPMPAGMSLDEAAVFVASAAVPFLDSITDPVLRHKARTAGSTGVIADTGAFQAIYRLAAKVMHPDAGGSASDWARLTQAAEILKKHHGIA